MQTKYNTTCTRKTTSHASEKKNPQPADEKKYADEKKNTQQQLVDEYTAHL